MKDNVILPIKYPIITSYTSDADILAILNSYPSTEEWIFNNYINLWGERPIDNDDELVLRFGSWHIRKACPYFKINTYNKSFFTSNIVELIISEINSGHYLYIQYDQYYISSSIQFKRQHFSHEMLIYGYDNKMKVFYIADFFENSKYTFVAEPFDCVESAISSALKWKEFSCDEIEFCHIKYKFSNYFLYNSLNNFLNSENNIAENERVMIADAEAKRIQEGQYTFGIKNYNLLKFTLSRILNDKITFNDIRPLYVLFDHKVMMCERLKYLAKIGVIDFNDPVIDKYTNIMKVCKNNYNLFIKFRITNDYKLIDKILNNINTIEPLEIETIKYLIESLSTKL